MHVEILNLQDHVKLNKKMIIKSAEGALKAMGETDSELSLLFVDDPYIKRLNLNYRNINAATDVLAFSIREGKALSGQGLLLGDVVISAQTAKREAGKRGVQVKEEMLLYMTHGILHLLGYDDKGPGDRKKMESKQRELLRLM